MPTTSGSTTALSGHLGKAVIQGELITKLGMWQLNHSVGESAWGDSESEGFTNRMAARADGTGTIGAKFDKGKKPYSVFRAGDLVTLALWQSTATGDYWYFPSALIQSFALEINPDTKEVVGWTANFGADGKFYYPTENGKTSASLPSS